MSESTSVLSTPIGPVTDAPAKKKAVKKSAPAKATKKTAKPAKATKKAPVKKAAKPSENGRAKKEGLRSAQVRILKYLAKQPKPRTRNEIADKAPADRAFCSQFLGRIDAEKRAAADEAYGFPSLLTLKAIKADTEDRDGKDTIVFSITAHGKSLLAKTE